MKRGTHPGYPALIGTLIRSTSSCRSSSTGAGNQSSVQRSTFNIRWVAQPPGPVSERSSEPRSNGLFYPNLRDRSAAG